MSRMWWRIRSAAAARSATRVPRSTACVIAMSFGRWGLGWGSGEVGAAVDVLGGAGQVPGLLGREEREQGGDVVHRGLPAQRDAGHDGLLDLRGGAVHPDVGVDRAGG